MLGEAEVEEDRRVAVEGRLVGKEEKEGGAKKSRHMSRHFESTHTIAI